MCATHKISYTTCLFYIYRDNIGNILSKLEYDSIITPRRKFRVTAVQRYIIITKRLLTFEFKNI